MKCYMSIYVFSNEHCYSWWRKYVHHDVMFNFSKLVSTSFPGSSLFLPRESTRIFMSSAIAMFIAKHVYWHVTFHVELSTWKSNSQVEFWRDWCAFGDSTFDLEIQTSSFADSPCVKIIVDMLTWMLMDKVERWPVTLKVDV